MNIDTIRIDGATRAQSGRAWHRCHGWGRTGVALGVIAAALGVTHARDARACGGCFAPPRPNEVTVVTDHRMAFSISTQQTVLWDQIRYSGNPSEFAWVLPIHPGARIELSRDEWMAALDATTQPVIVGPQRAPSGGQGCACGSSASATSGFASDNAGGGVQVIHQEVIGPYETATIRSTDPKALEAWLTAHGYDVPPAINPTIDAYTSEGFDFIALRLQPGQGVRAMKPVRVVTPGADLSLPLRMIAAGVGANVGLTLYVIGEGRYHPQNFPDVQVKDAALVWDNASNRSNYQELSEQAMASGDGRGWLTEYAATPLLNGPNSAGSYPNYGNYGGNGGTSAVPLDTAYYSVCANSRQGFTQSGAAGDDASADASADASSDDASADATTDSASDAASDSASDAQADDGGLHHDDGGLTSCYPKSSACCDFDDLDVASKGIHTGQLWVTRLRANLPASALTVGDLRLEATHDQTPVSNVHYAHDPESVPAGGACATVAPQGPGQSSRYGTWVTIGAALFGISALLRRRR